MASMTAQLVVGHSDMYHGGIYPTHIVWLSENSRPAWVLEAAMRDSSGAPGADPKDQDQPTWTQERVTWVPSAPEHILEDGLLLIALHVLRDESVLELAKSRLPALFEGEWLDLTKLEADALSELREQCSRSELAYKLIVTVLGGSALEEQLPILEQFPMEVEVCTVSYSRLSGIWSNEVEARGSLTASWASDGPTPDRYRDVNLTGTLPGALAETEQADAVDDLQVFARWIGAMDELKRRGLIRSANSAPIGGYAETLVARYFGTEPNTGRDEGYDLIRPDTGARVQVKARRDPPGRAATHFDFGMLTDNRFDEFAGVIFTETFAVKSAFHMPWESVMRLARDRPAGKHRLRISDISRAVSEGDGSITLLRLGGERSGGSSSEGLEGS